MIINWIMKKVRFALSTRREMKHRHFFHKDFKCQLSAHYLTY